MIGTRNPPAPDLPSLTGLRFWAAFSILLNHLLLGLVARDNALFSAALSNAGVLGMNAFFILSGFIIHYNYGGKLRDMSGRALWDFFVARFSRLYPLYILIIAVDVFTTNQHISGRELTQALPFFLTMSQSWVYYQVSDGISVTYLLGRANIAWSISTEMLMYCSYPLLLMMFKRDRLGHPARIATTAGAALLISLLLRLMTNNISSIDQWGVSLFGPQVGLEHAGAHSFAIWLTFLSPYVRVFEFIVGAATAHVFMRLRDTPVGRSEAVIGPLLALLALAFIVAASLPPGWNSSTLNAINTAIGYYTSLGMIVFACARYPRALSTSFFSLAPFVRLGEYSYSIYLFHIFVYSAVNAVPATAAVTVLRVAAVWAMVFSCAYVLYSCVEMPARRKLRSLLMRPQDGANARREGADRLPVSWPPNQPQPALSASID